MAGVTVFKLWMFDRVIDRLTVSNEQWQTRVDSLASEIGLGQVPEVRTTAGQISPLIWCLRRTPVLVLPLSLLDSLDDIQSDQIIVHELAHLRRRSQWVRWFELLVTVIYWWHPVLWIARNQMHHADEACCDSIVLKHYPGDSQTYGASLLRSAEFLQGSHAQPPLALNFSPFGSLKRRMKMVLDHKRMPAISPVAKALLALFACAALAFSARAIAVTTVTTLDNRPANTIVTVTDPTGKPVAGADVTMRITRVNPTDRRALVTDANGRCDIGISEIAPKSVLEVVVKVPNYVPMVGYWRCKDEKKLPASLDFQLRSGTKMGGTVIDELGRPVKGAKVVFLASAREATGSSIHLRTLDFETETDAAGKWQCDHCPDHSEYAQCDIRHDDFVAFRDFADKPDFQRLRDQSYQLTLKRGYRIAGTVTDGSGMSIAGAHGIAGLGIGSANLDCQTDGNGNYEITSVPPGVQPVTFLAKGFSPMVQELTIDGSDMRLDFELSRGKPTKIKVTDPTGKPIADAKVAPNSWQHNSSIGSLFSKLNPEKTDADGKFQWDNAPQGQTTYTISANGFATSRGQPNTFGNVFQPSDQEHVMVLYPQLKVSGKVIDKTTQEPIREFKVTRGVPGEKGQPYWHDRETVVGRDGKFEWVQAHDDKPKNLFRIESPGRKPFVTREVALAEGSADLTVELESSSSRTIALVAPDGQPVESAKVFFCLPGIGNGPYVRNGAAVDSQEAQPQLEVERGRFKLDQQATDFILLIFSDQGYARVTKKDIAEVDHIDLQAWARVEGIAKIGAKPAVNETIELKLQHEPASYLFDYEVKTDPNGKFVFERVPADMQDVTVYRSFTQYRGKGMGGRLQAGIYHQPITLKAGKTTTVKLGGSGKPVIGRLIVPANTEKPTGNWNARGVQLTTKNSKGEEIYYGVFVQEDGAFRVDDLPAGEYQMRATIHDGFEKVGMYGRYVGSTELDFTIKLSNGGLSEEPLDLGDLQLKK